jgi:hypothetical protein
MIKQFCCLLLLCSCLWWSVPSGALAQASSTIAAEQTTIVGTIKATGVEGGCYQLQADDGQRYELMGKFPKRDGFRVKVKGTIAQDVMTICQVGQTLRVKSWRPAK